MRRIPFSKCISGGYIYYQAVLALTLLLMLCGVMNAQNVTVGSFIGTVTDTSGSSIPGAEVSAKHLSTGLVQTVSTDQSGNFAIVALPAGYYSVSVSSPGFKRWEVGRVELIVGDRSRIAPVLTVGEITEIISVEDSQEILQTEKGSVETSVQMQQVRELPLPTRNPLYLVGMAPGMRWESSQDGGERATYVQGQGLRNNKAGFQLDGVNTNAPMDEGGTGIPNVDAVAEVKIQTLNFSAESGRNPLQIMVVTKSGSNNFHGALWSFTQNDAFNARNTFAASRPTVRRNQFGAALGGPIIKNKTFFFGNYEGTIIRNARIYNSLGVTPAMKRGDFSALSKTIIDPTTNSPFPGNVIPDERISSASKYFLPYILEANSPDGFYRNNASAKNDTHEGTLRIDHMITQSQRIYARYYTVRQPQDQLGYVPDPSIIGYSNVEQHSGSLNYTWTITPNTLLTASGGLLRHDSTYGNPSLGKQNDVRLAGIQGIPDAGRERWVGPPNISFASGYTGVSFPGGWGVPGSLYGDSYNFKSSISHIKRNHTFSAGFEYGDWRTFGAHGSAAPRGAFTFGNLYTGDGFADYLLGYVSSTNRNDPLQTFGNDRAPYAAGYVQDVWRIRENLTLELGIRYERWLAHHSYQEISSTWDPRVNKVVTAVNSSGQPNLTAFPVTPHLAEATKDLWITSRDAGMPDGLYEANGNWAPRLGIVYRPFGKRDFVIRSGYGVFYNSFTGNRGASTLNVPHWSLEGLTISPNTLQRWETVWPADPSAFSAFNVYAPLYNIKPARTHEWNVSIQAGLPFRTALTVTYAGTKVNNEVGGVLLNEATIGSHPNLQAARPFPRFAGIQVYDNIGKSWYHSLQTKAERRFSSGWSFLFAYAFSRSMMQNQPSGEADALLPYSPDWYNRGRTPFDFRHVQSTAVVWEVPFGRGKKIATDLHPVANFLLGGWQLSVWQRAQSGAPLSISAGTPSLGNGFTPRANVVGNPAIDNPSPSAWFNRSAFAAPPQYAFGNSGIGLIEGPGAFSLDSNLSKNFHITESKYFQFRWEAFNLINRVNYGNPDTTLTSGNFGRITGAGSARYMQLGLKFLF